MSRTAALEFSFVFMKQRIKDAGRNVYLILDKLRVHHAKLVKAWLQRHQSEI